MQGEVEELPDVEFRVKKGVLGEDDLMVIPRELQAIVSMTLDCSDPGGALTPEEVEVRVTEVGPYDVNAVDVAVLVVANDFPSRKANIQERVETIAKAFKLLLPAGLKAFVWVTLCPAGFTEFET